MIENSSQSTHDSVSQSSDTHYSVYRVEHDRRVLVESDLPEIIAKDMVADYAAEGVECVMEREDGNVV